MSNKITDRDEYTSASGYHVVVEGTYRRTRKIRATSPEQTKEFAVARESKSAGGVFNARHHIAFEFVGATAIKAEPAPTNPDTGDVTE